MYKSLQQQLLEAHEARKVAWEVWKSAVDNFNATHIEASEIGDTLDGRPFKIQKRRVRKKNGKLGKRYFNVLVSNPHFPEVQRRFNAFRDARSAAGAAEQNIHNAIKSEEKILLQIRMAKNAAERA